MGEIKKKVPQEILTHINFRGLVRHEDLPTINASACILAYPSWMETQGIVVIEGMASGKPVIASSTGPGPELIDDGINGFLCDPFSPESIAEKIILLLENEELRKEIAKRGRIRALSHFSVNVLVEKNIEFYEKCLHEN
jgi:glycosyltransferase involved in cell wall biosynthesis